MRRPVQAGFTLIELVVSLTLLGLMIGLIAAAVPLALSGAANTRWLSDNLSAVQTSQDLLRRQIGGMPALVTQDGYDRRIIFSGSSDQMRFAAYPLRGQGGGGPQMVTLSVEQSGAGLQLKYVSGDESRYLVTGAQDIQFSYFGARQSDAAAAWRKDWEDALHLPRLVRIQVRRTKTDLPWPDFVIAVQAEGPPP